MLEFIVGSNNIVYVIVIFNSNYIQTKMFAKINILNTFADEFIRDNHFGNINSFTKLNEIKHSFGFKSACKANCHISFRKYYLSPELFKNDTVFCTHSFCYNLRNAQ